MHESLIILRDKIIKYKLHLSGILFGVLYMVFLLSIHDIKAGDYQFFVQEPYQLTYMIDRWFEWSSRLLIELSVNLFSKNIFLWILISISLSAIMFVSLSRLLNIKTVFQNILLLCLLMLINSNILTSAGLFATSINYMWPVSLYLFFISSLFRPFRNTTLRKVSNIFMWPALIFAVCSEQIALGSFIIGIIYICWLLWNRKTVSTSIKVMVLISLAGVINTLLSPGNDIRTAQEIIQWWPAFTDIPLYSKLAYGSLFTFSRIFFAPEILPILLVISLSILTYKKRILGALGSIIPSLVLIVLFFIPATAGEAMNGIVQGNKFNELRSSSLNMSPENIPSNSVLLIIILMFVFICISISLTIYLTYGRKFKTLVILSVLGAGLAMSLAISLSPTMYASSTRTLFPLMITLVAINYIVINDILKYDFKYKYINGK